LLFVSVVVATDGSAFAQAGDAALVVGPGVLVVGLCLGPSARRKCAGRVEYAGEVAELDPGVVSGGLVPVIARSVERLEGDDRFLAAGVAG
jgi:hypothetical protein